MHIRDLTIIACYVQPHVLHGYIVEGEEHAIHVVNVVITKEGRWLKQVFDLYSPTLVQLALWIKILDMYRM